MRFAQTPLAVFVSVMFVVTSVAEAQDRWFVDDDGAAGNGCTSWPDACPELQTALDLAGFADRIWVAEGIYRPSKRTDPEDARTATFQLLNNVSIYGGFAGGETTLGARAGLFEQTILTGDLDGDDPSRAENAYHVVTGSGTDPTAVLDGFTITAGNANGPFPTGDRGAGIFCHSGSPTIGRCVIRDNKASLIGGGLHCRRDSDLRLYDCAIIGNTAGNRGGGIHAFFDSDLRLEKCRILNNTARLGGGGIHTEQESNITILNSIIANNQVTDENGGGGGLLASRSDPQIHASAIVGNSARRTGGGLLLVGGETETILSSCLIADNWSGGNGGGVYLVLNSATIVNCTIAHNFAANLGGGIFSARNELVVANSILWNDVATLGSEMYLFYDHVHNEAADVSVSYSDVAGGSEAVFVEAGSALIWGLGNIEVDPQFSAPDRESYRLLPGSPCIDAGDNTAVPTDAVDQDNDGDTGELLPFDLDGQSRLINDLDTADTGNSDGIHSAVDMGAFEFSCVDFDGDGKLTLCHRSPGNPEHTRDLEVSLNAVFSHLSHGDHCGPCGGDCNGNGNPDADDVADGISSDCNGNEFPDECEPDCNENLQADSCDIADQVSADCDGNGVPDECDPDCNANGHADVCDIESGASADCDANGVPDECQPDCNDTGLIDPCDILQGFSDDCDGDLIPDECDPDPLIIEQPADQEVEAGAAFTFFSVQAVGVVFEFQWRKDGVELADGNEFLGTTADTMIVVDVQPEDAGAYDCEVTELANDCSTVSDPATLTVLIPRQADLDGDGEVRVPVGKMEKSK